MKHMATLESVDHLTRVGIDQTYRAGLLALGLPTYLLTGEVLNRQTSRVLLIGVTRTKHLFNPAHVLLQALNVDL